MTDRRYGLGHFNSPVHIVFGHDHNGRKVAYRYHMPNRRRIRMSLVLAELIVAAEAAASVEYANSKA